MFRKILIILTFLIQFPLLAERPVYGPMLDRLIYQVSKEYKKLYGLECVGTGGALSQDVEAIMLSYQSYKKYTIEEIRPLLINLTQSLINTINANEEIRQYLHNYPFSINNIFLSIRSRDIKEHLAYDAPYIANASNCKGKIEYTVAVLNEWGNKYPIADQKVVLVETFEEAVKLVEQATSKEAGTQTYNN